MIFCMPGVQTGVLTVAGRPVALAAQDDQLAVVWHGGLPAADGDQALQYSVYRISAQSKAHSGALYLSGRSHLSWLGFSETGVLAAYDTQVLTQPTVHAAVSTQMFWQHSIGSTYSWLDVIR